MSDNDAPEQNATDTDEEGKRREAVRLTTVFGGRVCQFGKAYACIISDVSAGGAKVRLKDPHDFTRITQEGEAQLIFERLSDYKALNAVVAWVKPAEHTIGLRFIDPELRRRIVIKRLMPTRWRLANDRTNDQNQDDQVASGTGES